jgi:hypothetical protein
MLSSMTEETAERQIVMLEVSPHFRVLQFIPPGWGTQQGYILN